MAEPAASSNDGLSDRLEGLFSSVKGPPRPESRPTGAPPVPVESADPPELGDGTILQAVDVPRLVRYLDAQLGEAREEAAAGVAAVLAAVQALDRRLQAVEARAAGADRQAAEVAARLEDFAKALFEWFESFSQWNTGRFDRLDHLMSQLLGVPARRHVDDAP